MGPFGKNMHSWVHDAVKAISRLKSLLGGWLLPAKRGEMMRLKEISIFEICMSGSNDDRVAITSLTSSVMWIRQLPQFFSV